VTLAAQQKIRIAMASVMNIKWDYNYYQPWSDNEWLVDEMLAMQDEDVERGKREISCD